MALIELKIKKRLAEVYIGKLVLVFNGCGCEQGNSSTLADKAVEGAKAARAQVESFFLHRMDIRPCDACGMCQETGVCALKDDRHPPYLKLQQTNRSIFAYPIYYFTMCAQTG
jgi:multimeric flavodoxin WrbA